MTDPGSPDPSVRLLRRARPRAWLPALGLAAVGAGLAGAYAHLVGCRTGTCPLTSSVPLASLYGGLTGLVVGWPTRPRRPGRGPPPGS